MNHLSFTVRPIVELTSANVRGKRYFMIFRSIQTHVSSLLLYLICAQINLNCVEYFFKIPFSCKLSRSLSVKGAASTFSFLALIPEVFVVSEVDFEALIVKFKVHLPCSTCQCTSDAPYL